MDAFIIRTKALASSLNAEEDNVKFMSGQAKDVKEQADDLIMIDDNAPSSTTGVDGGHLGKSVMVGVTSPCSAKSAPAIEAKTPPTETKLAKSAPAIEAKTPPTETKLKTPLLAKRSAPLAASSGSGEGDVKKKKNKPSRVGGKTLEQRRRELGDSVKSRIQVCVFFFMSVCVCLCVCVCFASPWLRVFGHLFVSRFFRAGGEVVCRRSDTLHCQHCQRDIPVRGRNHNRRTQLSLFMLHFFPRSITLPLSIPFRPSFFLFSTSPCFTPSLSNSLRSPPLTH